MRLEIWNFEDFMAGPLDAVSNLTSLSAGTLYSSISSTPSPRRTGQDKRRKALIWTTWCPSHGIRARTVGALWRVFSVLICYIFCIDLPWHSLQSLSNWYSRKQSSSDQQPSSMGFWCVNFFILRVGQRLKQKGQNIAFQTVVKRPMDVRTNTFCAVS